MTPHATLLQPAVEQAHAANRPLYVWTILSVSHRLAGKTSVEVLAPIEHGKVRSARSIAQTVTITRNCRTRSRKAKSIA